MPERKRLQVQFSSCETWPRVHDFEPSLDFEYLVGGCPQDGNVNLGIGISGIVVHSRILVDNPSGSVCSGHDFNFGFVALNATGRSFEAPIGSTITLNVQAAGQSH